MKKKYWIFGGGLLVLTLGFLRFALDPGPGLRADLNVNTQNQLNKMADQTRTLTITYVKRPWYALDFLIKGRFEQSIPQYQKIKGLERKYYALHQWEQTATFGGIYIWDSLASAKKVLSEKWFEKVRKRYKTEGYVQYFEILEAKQQPLPEQQTGSAYAVLSDEWSGSSPTFASALAVYRLKALDDQKEKTLALWPDQKIALSCYPKNELNSAQKIKAPVLLNNLAPSLSQKEKPEISYE